MGGHGIWGGFGLNLKYVQNGIHLCMSNDANYDGDNDVSMI